MERGARFQIRCRFQHARRTNVFICMLPELTQVSPDRRRCWQRQSSKG